MPAAYAPVTPGSGVVHLVRSAKASVPHESADAVSALNRWCQIRLVAPLHITAFIISMTSRIPPLCFASQESTTRLGALIFSIVFLVLAFYAKVEMGTSLLLLGVAFVLFLFAAYAKYTLVDIGLRRVIVKHWLIVPVFTEEYDLNTATKVELIESVGNRRRTTYKLYLSSSHFWLYLRSYSNVGFAIECADDLAKRAGLPLNAFDRKRVLPWSRTRR